MPIESFVQYPPDSTGKKARTIQEVVGLNTVEQEVIALRDSPTFFAVYDRIVPAAAKYMATIWNGAAGRIVKVLRIWSLNWQVATVTGVLHEHELRRITARTVGTAVTPVPADTSDVLTAGITADHASTAVTESTLLRRFFGASEEVKIGAMTFETELGAGTDVALAYDGTAPGIRPIELRQNQGLTAKMITSTAVGSGSFVIEFCDELV